jgi:dienelactone hydrolase
MTCQPASLFLGVALLLNLDGLLYAQDASAVKENAEAADQARMAKALLGYYEQMCRPKPLVVRRGEEFAAHRRGLKERLRESVGLQPLPARVPLDAHESAPLDHPWCTVRRLYYQLWPGVYSSGLLYLPKTFAEKPAPAMLCPHGHWADGNVDPEVQKRCLNFARLGYVTFSPAQNHYEDLDLGISHQTLMIWNNMRALDYLESLPAVDKARIGVAGESGGGLQTEMLLALDSRVKAATIVGLTCEFRQIMFPDGHHCPCNHFPNVMRFTDHPEISALGFPTPVQYLTMNDWTKDFQKTSFPTIQQLYADNGFADRVQCQYFDTPHNYDRRKREETYAWMERWLRGKKSLEPVREPDDVTTFPAERLKTLAADVPANKGFAELSGIYKRERGYRVPGIRTAAEWQEFRERMTHTLTDLLGGGAVLPRKAAKPGSVRPTVKDGLAIERVEYPSEGGILVPAIVLRLQSAQGKLPVVVILAAAGKDALVKESGPGSAVQLAGQGSLVVLPDLRVYGELAATGSKPSASQRAAWERNGIVWGRPVPGMTCTDLGAVLDGLATRSDVDMSRLEVIARGSGDLAVAVLFAGAIDRRIGSADVDLGNACFEKRNLALVPSVLLHGDVYQWAALWADRRLTLRNAPAEAGTPEWLVSAFAVMGNREGLRNEPLAPLAGGRSNNATGGR